MSTPVKIPDLAKDTDDSHKKVDERVLQGEAPGPVSSACSSSSSSENDTDDEEVDPTSDEPITNRISKALSLKEEGNVHFKSGELERAVRSYRRGTSALKSLNEKNTGDSQVRALLLSLQTNLSLVCLKQGKAKMSRDVASKALEIDETNIKALYRRGVAYRALGDVKKASNDLRTAFKLDPENREVKRELISLKKDIEALKAKEKASLGGFLNSNMNLYEDKEKEKAREEARKTKEKEEQEKAKEEALKKRKKRWEDECVARMSRDEPAVSYGEWDKEQQAREEEEKKRQKLLEKEEEEKKRKEREEQRKQERGKESDDNDSDEEILKDVRGYKKLSDGRTTSYFTRELGEREKALIGDITPKMIDSSNHSSVPSEQDNSKNDTLKRQQSSAWNSAGTWEERDTSEWCRARFKAHLSDATAIFGEYAAVVSQVDEVFGDASVAVVSGKKTIHL